MLAAPSAAPVLVLEELSECIAFSAIPLSLSIVIDWLKGCNGGGVVDLVCLKGNNEDAVVVDDGDEERRGGQKEVG